MSNIFTNVPVPSANGAGAATDISNLGWLKQLVMTGSFLATVNVMVSNDGLTWAPLATFLEPGTPAPIPFAAKYVQAVVSNYQQGSPILMIGSDDLGVTVVYPIPVPVTNDTGSAVNILTNGQKKTFIYGGGTVASFNVEVSGDGINFAQLVTFSGPTPAYINVDASIYSVRISVSGYRAGGPAITSAISMSAAVPESQTSTAPSTSFVFRPGGVADGNVYVDWATLCAAILPVQGAKYIQFDDTIVSPIVIPAGTWDMHDVEWNGHIIAPTFIDVVEGCILPGLRSFNHSIRITFLGSTPPISDFNPLPGENENIILEKGSEITCAGAGPFIRNTGLVAPVNVVFTLGARFNTGANPVLDIGAGAQCTLILCTISDLQPDTISGAVGSALVYGIASSGLLGFSMNQPAFLGGSSIFNTTIARMNPTGTVTGNTNVNGNDAVRCDPSGGGFTVTLPLAANTYGQTIVVKNVSGSANVIAISPSGADTVDGAAGANIAAARGVLRLMSDGVSDWMIV